MSRLADTLRQLGTTEEEWHRERAAFRAEERAYRRAMRSTARFAAWRNPDYEPGRFHDELAGVCDAIVQSAYDGEAGWYALSAPPRHGKTELVGRAMAPRAMALRPGFSVLYATSSEKRAREVSGRVRSAVSRLSGRYAHLRPGRVWTNLEWETEGGNAWVGAGANSGTGGIGCHLLILDDVTGSSRGYGSKNTRDTLWRWIEEDCLSRVMDGGAVVVMETRRGVDDLRARFEDRYGSKLQSFDWPLVYDREHSLTDPSHDHRQIGDYLWKYGREWHDTQPHIKGQLYAQLYQQRPTPDEGALWNRAWLSRRYPGTPDHAGRTCLQRVLSVDGAATHGAGDHTVIQHWGFRSANALLLGQWRGQWDYPTFEATLRDIIAKTQPHGTLIENTSNGRAVYQTLSQKVPGMMPINVSGMGGKRDRIRPTLTLWEAGNILLPDASVARWVPDYVERMLRVTGVGDEVDDEADATTIALRWWQDRAGKKIQVW